MSPLLKQLVPSGSMGLDIWEPQAPSQAKIEREKTVEKGWRLETLGSSADALIAAATRLEGEVRKETTYWDQVLSLKEKGWSVRGLLRERHTLGVQLGFAEARDQFRDRGFVPLRVNSDGDIRLDSNLVRQQKAVRVRIRHGDTIAACSKTPYRKTTTIHDHVMAARDSLFEEELFHEMTLETRITQNYDIKLRDSVIELPMDLQTPISQSAILIDLVTVDQQMKGPGIDPQPGDEPAQKIALALRLLLVYAHRKRLRNRSALPPPLTEKKPPIPTAPILRPVLNHLQHYAVTRNLQRYLAANTDTLAQAGIDVRLAVSYEKNLHELVETVKKGAVTTMSQAAPPSTVETLLATLLTPLQTNASLNLNPSSDEKAPWQLTIDIRTHLSQPTNGTIYTLALPTSLASLVGSTNSATRRLTFQTSDDIREYLDNLLGVHIAHNVIAQLDSKRCEGLPRVGQVIVGPKQVENGKAEKRATPQGARKIGVQLKGAKLCLRWISSAEEASGEATWMVGESEPGLETRKLVDVVGKILNT